MLIRFGGEGIVDNTHTEAHVEVEERKGYVLIRVSGALPTEVEVDRLSAFISDTIERTGLRKLLIDARALEVPFPDDACHRAWEWIHARRYDQLACVMPAASDLVLTRLNMTGVSSGLPFRAFPSVIDAHRWLEMKLSGVHRRPSSSMIPAQKPMSEPPPAGSAPPAPYASPPRKTSTRSSSMPSGAYELPAESLKPKSATDPEHRS